MFGYITVNTALLTKEQQERYRRAYCGLCRALREKCGTRGRAVLSNDMTFLALLLNSLYEPEKATVKEACPIHPVTGRTCDGSEMTDYAADMNLLLSWYKAEDDLRDGDRSAASLVKKSLDRAMPGVRQRWPEQCRAVGAALEEFSRLEKGKCQDIDRLCILSGEMLASVFAPRADEWSATLRRLGMGLGRFVLVMDAYEDLVPDRKRGRFNPLEALAGQPDFETFCHDTLQMLMGEATQAFEFLPLEQDLPILRNVLYSGVWTRWAQLHSKEMKGLNKADDE